MERRIFLRNFGRIFLLGGMVAASAYLVASGKVEKRGNCKTSSTCGSCSKLSSCNEQQAAVFRKAEYK